MSENLQYILFQLTNNWNIIRNDFIKLNLFLILKIL